MPFFLSDWRSVRKIGQSEKDEGYKQIRTRQLFIYTFWLTNLMSFFFLLLLLLLLHPLISITERNLKTNSATTTGKQHTQRFCFDSKPLARKEKVNVNLMNVKEIFVSSKKARGVRVNES